MVPTATSSPFHFSAPNLPSSPHLSIYSRSHCRTRVSGLGGIQLEQDAWGIYLTRLTDSDQGRTNDWPAKRCHESSDKRRYRQLGIAVPTWTISRIELKGASNHAVARAGASLRGSDL